MFSAFWLYAQQIYLLHDLYGDDGAQFDALVIDVDMPRLNGRQALAAIAAVAPGLSDRAVVMSGGAWEGDVAKWLGALPAHRVLRKPMSNDDLREAVRRALE